ncbi:MAG: hypothetical protein KKF80_04680, partial [Candidatus Omnitrophica bacterium]|nr:hypothetical protein [Candidatus Omnitrophota bacterium]
MKIELIATQKVLSPTQIAIADYCINPYQGCEFGCLYCYAHKNKNLKDRTMGTYIGVKINAPAVLRQQLQYTRPKRVLLGSTTECFQYHELKYNVTEQILAILNTYEIPYTILTKSYLIKEYLPLIAHNSANKIYFTFNCARDTLIEAIEKNSSTITQRLNAIGAILNHTIDLRIHVGPFIPHYSSLEDILMLLPENVREIDIELYHHSMGNFGELRSRIEQVLGAQASNDLAGVY